MKLYTVIPVSNHTGKQHKPRYDLVPMDHKAACNFMDACSTEFTRYLIHPWPDNVPKTKPIMTAKAYSSDTAKK